MDMKNLPIFSDVKELGHPNLYTLLYIEKGSGRIRINDAVYQVDAGEAFLLPPCCMGRKVGEWDKVCGGFLFVSADMVPYREYTTLYPDETGKKQLKAMIFQNRQGNMQALFMHLFEEPVHPKSTHFSEIKRYVQDNLHTKLSQKAAASDMGISPAVLGTVCKEKFGKSFGAYVTQIRLDHAKYLLQNHALTISEISKRLGFSSVQYFTTVFKKETGMTPYDFRKYVKI